MIWDLQAESWVEVDTKSLKSNIFTELTPFVLIDEMGFAKLEH